MGTESNGHVQKIATVAIIAVCPIQSLLSLGFGHRCCSVVVSAGRSIRSSRRLQARALQTQTCLSRPPSNRYP